MRLNTLTEALNSHTPPTHTSTAINPKATITRGREKLTLMP